MNFGGYYYRFIVRFPDRVGFPLHNIQSTFLSVMDTFFVDLKFCHIRFYTLTMSFFVFQPSSAFNFKLHTFHHQILITFLITCPYHLSLPLLMTVVIGSTLTNFLNSSIVVVVYPLPCPLFVGGIPSSCFWSTSQLISPSGLQLHHSSRVCPQIQG